MSQWMVFGPLLSFGSARFFSFFFFFFSHSVSKTVSSIDAASIIIDGLSGTFQRRKFTKRSTKTSNFHESSSPPSSSLPLLPQKVPNNFISTIIMFISFALFSICVASCLCACDFFCFFFFILGST